MSLKYRVRLANDRVIGPLTAEEIGELYLKNHIDGSELAQQFPIGDWRKINSYPNLQNIINQNKNQNATTTKVEPVPVEEEPVREITHSGLKTFKEFKFGKNVNLDIDYNELEKKYKKDSPQDSAEDDNKTRIVKRKKPEPQIDKTVVIPSKANMPKKETTETKNRKEIEKKLQEEEQSSAPLAKTPSKEELVNEKTEFLNLAQVLPSINAQLSVSEVELDQQKRIEENNERLRQKELQEQIEAEAEEEDSFEVDDDYDPNDVQSGIEQVDTTAPKKPKKKKKKSMSIIVALAFLGIFYVLLSPEETQKVQGPQYIEIKFPVTQEYEDKAGAEAALQAGRNLYAKNTYVARSLASLAFVKSLEKQFNNNAAFGELLLTYAELMDNSRDPEQSANTIYKLVQLAENKLLNDLNVVTGTALFYGNLGKYLTGINIIKNYFRAKNPASSKLLAYYLHLLIKADDLAEARTTFNKLKEIPKKPAEAYFYLSEFYDVDDQRQEARATIDEGLKYFPNSVMLLLKKADYLFKDQEEKKYEQVLLKINQLQSENSPIYTAKFYHHMGILSAFKKKIPEANKFFKKSLDIKETDELRTLLSSLEVEGDNFSQKIILESKVIALINKAKAELKNNNLELAFTYSVEAIDAYPEFVPAILLHTELQLKRGLFDAAINSLLRAISSNPQNNTLKKTLVTAYMRAYKFEEAQKALVELAQTKYAFGSDYASMMGDFYLAKNNLTLATRWYGESLNRKPLSDYNMYQLAKIYIRLKKFTEAKKWLARALLLDPRNVEYLASNSEILFEQDNTDTALGYLRDAISDLGEQPRLISAIASIYFKSGQLKEFNAYYKRIQEMPKKDESFYEFLIYAAKLEEKNEDYVTYSRELLKLNPGNLNVRLNLGEFFLNNRKYPEAIAELEEVRKMLESYPKVHFLLAKVYMATNDIAKAKAMALKELDLNPGLDSAYFIVGEVARLEKDYREAVFKYERAISINPRSVEALMAMAWIRLAQNYASEAIELYNRALKEDKNNPEIHKQIGMAYKAAGQRALAREKFEDYLKLSPGAEDRDQIEAQIRNLQ